VAERLEVQRHDGDRTRRVVQQPLAGRSRRHSGGAGVAGQSDDGELGGTLRGYGV
jgi:hypothetical protein